MNTNKSRGTLAVSGYTQEQCNEGLALARKRVETLLPENRRGFLDEQLKMAHRTRTQLLGHLQTANKTGDRFNAKSGLRQKIAAQRLRVAGIVRLQRELKTC